MTVELTYDEAVEFLERAVEERGKNYIIPGGGCKYFNLTDTDGQRMPSCLIGYVLAYKGLTYDDVRDVNGMTVPWLYHKEIITSDPKTRQLLATAQLEQDEKHPWGYAVKKAKRFGEGFPA